MSLGRAAALYGQKPTPLSQGACLVSAHPWQRQVPLQPLCSRNRLQQLMQPSAQRLSSPSHCLAKVEEGAQPRNQHFHSLGSLHRKQVSQSHKADHQGQRKATKPTRLGQSQLAQMTVQRRAAAHLKSEHLPFQCWTAMVEKSQKTIRLRVTLLQWDHRPHHHEGCLSGSAKEGHTWPWLLLGRAPQSTNRSLPVRLICR
mmetsp:Transcript_15285/g.35800  ORF Transcript_15285/g.35800 Transcript_15285/m.35800 type:complete len:200 (+) Transcript_15285:406-1005(+)